MTPKTVSSLRKQNIPIEAIACISIEERLGHFCCKRLLQNSAWP